MSKKKEEQNSSWTTKVILKGSPIPFHLCAACNTDNNSLAGERKAGDFQRTIFFFQIDFESDSVLEGQSLVQTFLLGAAAAYSVQTWRPWLTC